MKRHIRNGTLIVLFVVVGGYLSSQQAHAASLSSVSDTITTSRPSAASPLNGNAASGAGIVTIYNNGSYYLASDSASIVRAGTVIDSGLDVSQESSALTTVYLAKTLSTAAQGGTDVLLVPITAMHNVQFTDTGTTVPSGGKIVITFPGSGVNTASPSATAFSFNGLANTQVKVNGASCSSITVSAPTITCTLSAQLTPPATVNVLIGCTANTGANCTTQDPLLINPTKTASVGNADTWNVAVATQDSSGNPLDSATTVIGTIESVQVSANVNPSLTFIISSLNSGVTICTNDTTTIDNHTTPAAISLGAVPSGTYAIAGQLLDITTNAPNGYTLTATSSGHLINPATGYWLTDYTSPTIAPAAGTTFFGIRPCGASTDVASGTWPSGAVGAGVAEFAWPNSTTPLSLASNSNGPIAGTSGQPGYINIEYVADVATTFPAGTYRSTITYVATPSF